MIRFRSRKVWGVLAAVVVLVGGLLFSLNAAGVISGRDTGHDSSEARDHDSDNGEQDEDDGGPEVPAEYLHQKFTSFGLAGEPDTDNRRARHGL